MAVISDPTLQRLLKDIRVFLNQPNATNSFWKDDELTSYVNDAIKQYFVVINEVAEGQFDTKTTLDLVSGVETVALPSDCFEVKAIYIQNGDRNEILPYYNNVKDGYATSTSGSSDSYNPYYYFRGESLVLRPIPGFSKTAALTIEYTAFPDTVITGLDTLTSGISPIFKELVVMYAVYKAKIKESLVSGTNTYAPVAAHLSDLFTTFKSSVASRSKYPQYVAPYNP